MEFLMGRWLSDNLCNLGLGDQCRAVLAEFGVRLEDVLEVEPDAGLGNGGLGRLAFMQSLRPDPAARYEVVTAGHLEGADPEADAAIIAEWEAAGATWFQEGFMPDDDLDLVRARIRLGPPRG